MRAQILLCCLSLVCLNCSKPNRDEEKKNNPETIEKAGLRADTLWDPPSNAIHIDPTANDPEEDGTLEHPYNALSDFKWKSNAVYALKRGTTLKTSATIAILADNFTLASYGKGERPIINSSVVNEHAVQIAWDTRHDVTVRDIEIVAPQAISCLIFRSNSTNMRLINCKLHGATWGLRVLADLNGVTIDNVEVYDIKDDGMFIQAVENIEIKNCYVHDVNQNWKPPHTPETEAGGDGIQLDRCNHWYVHHNKIDRSSSGNKFCFIANNAAQDDGIFEYNYLLGPKVDGFSIYIGDGKNEIIRYNYITGGSNSPFYTHASNVKVYYNIFTNIKGPLYADGGAEIYNNLFYGMKMAIQGKSIVARNNIFDLDSVDSYRFKVANFTEDHNLFVRGSATAESIPGDPKYKNQANGDFHLQSSSDCIQKGINIGLTQDMNGVPIPTGKVPDIGPYEFK